MNVQLHIERLVVDAATGLEPRHRRELVEAITAELERSLVSHPRWAATVERRRQVQLAAAIMPTGPQAWGHAIGRGLASTLTSAARPAATRSAQ